MKRLSFLFLCGMLLLTATSAYAGRIGVLGKNTYGQFGTGTTDGATMNLTSVTQIGSDADWIDVACGKYHSLALKANGTLWAWGYNNAGQLGDGSTTNQISPVQIGSDTDWKQFDGGENFTLAIKTDGTLWAWGDNSYGQFGNGTTTASLTPVQIGADNDWKVVECGAFHTIALKTDGSLWAWGYNSVGQVGNATTTTQTTPVQIGTDKTWKKISAGGNTSLALKQDDLLWNWGATSSGNSTTPVNTNTEKFNEISASYQYMGANGGPCFAGIGSNGIGGPKLPFPAGYYYWDVSAKKMLLATSQLIPTYRPFSDACNSCLFQIASSSLAIGGIKTKNAYSFATSTDGKLVGITAVQRFEYHGNEITSTIPWGKPIAGFEHLLVLEQTGQTVTFNALTDKAVGDADFTVSAATNAYVDAVVFASSDESVAKCTGTNGATLQIIGTGTCTITATQAGNGCWKAATATQTLKVKNKPLITWSNPADIASGTALSATQLNATADVAGTFVYSPAIGSVLAAGDNQELSVIFTPTDDANYITTSYSVFINVTKPSMKLKFTTTAASQSISLPLNGTVNCTVNWGDGTAVENFTTTGDKPHTFATAGTYTVSISGSLTWFGAFSAWAGVEYLTSISDFGSIGLTDLTGAFIEADNLTSVPTTLPTTVTNLGGCFSFIDQNSITNLDSWNTSSVTNMRSMFLDASAFNQNISNWDVSNVTNMSYMFQGTSFNQNIGSWNISKVTEMENMFKNVTLSTANYDALLIGWAAQTVKPNVVFSGGNSKYTAGAAATARGTLAGGTNLWTITDGGQDLGTSLENPNNNLSLQISPNPVRNQFSINGFAGNAEIAIMDMTGKVCQKTQVSSASVVSVGHLPKGMYVVQVNNENKTVRMKMIKE